MSKLFPMFKKKGKGKDEDLGHEEEPRRKGKTERVKEALRSPVGSSLSPSKSSKNKKKAKAAKEKSAQNGQVVSCHSPEEAEVHLVEEFYVDDDGLVKVGEQEEHSFVDEVMSSVEESFNLELEKTHRGLGSNIDDDTDANIDNKFESLDKDITPDHTNSDESGISHGSSPHDEKDSLESQEFSLISSVSEEHNKVVENNSENNQLCEEPLADEYKNIPDLYSYPSDSYKSLEIEKNDVNEIADECAPGIHDQLSDLREEEFTNQSPTLVTKDEIQIVSDNEEPSTATSYYSGIESLVTGIGNADGSGDMSEQAKLMEETAEKSQKPLSEAITISQDSDDDFDSAQEDWDEDEVGQDQALKHDTPSSSTPVLEAKNDSLIDGDEKSQSGHGRNRASSEYEDAKLTLQDVGLFEESSDDKLPSASEEGRKGRKIPGSEKLVRKLSNISTASSDAFNEEVDDLLDEELDRLSEEEESALEATTTRIQDHESVECKAPEEKKSHETDSLESTHEHSGKVDGEINDGEKAMSSTDSPKKESGDNQHLPVIHTNLPEDCNGIRNDQHSSNTRKEESEKKTNLSTTDDVSEHVKDSGYYSLPVSPNPGAIVRASSENEHGTKGADDSFGDSEEEGMITPPCEVSSSGSKTSGQKESMSSTKCHADTTGVSESIVSHPGHEVKDVSVTAAKNENKTPNEDNSCAESQPSVQQTPKGSISLKVVIPNSSEKKKVEKMNSPNCTSPTKIRHKSPLKETEEAFTPDPIGDRFLEQAVHFSHEEAEARLAQRRAARAEARELRLRELEKQQQDQENEEEKQVSAPSFAEEEEEEDDVEEEEEEEPSPRSTAASRTAARSAGLNSAGPYSRRSSEDSTTDESALPANVREMRVELKELDEKFRKAMITNAQLDNEKSTLTYEVELIKDRYSELEETHTQLNKEHRRKCTEYEQLRKVSTKLQEEVKILRGMLQERDQLIQEYGLVVVGEEEENGEVPPEAEEFADMDDLTPRKIAVKKVLLSQEAAELIEKGASKSSLDVRLKKFGEEKKDLEDQVRRLKLELEEEKNNSRRRENGLDYEKAKEQSKTVNEYKFRVQKAEAEVLTLQANVARLDALSTRYKTQSEELEKSEEELKVERRKLQRELRDAQSRLEELETTNNHLIRRFDKLKNARSTLLKDLSQDPA